LSAAVAAKGVGIARATLYRELSWSLGDGAVRRRGLTGL
jgi:hypothetical protein